MRKWFASLRAFRTKNERDLSLVRSWERFQQGNAGVADFELIIADLTDFASYYYRPSFTDWVNTGKPLGSFETYCALLNARAEVVQHIMQFLTLPDEARIALERAVQRLNVR